MRKHHPSIAAELAWFRQAKGKRLRLPEKIRTHEDRRRHAELEANSALYEAPDNPTPEDILLANERSAIIERLIDRLPARAARVLRLRYGLGCEAQLLAEVGEQFGVGRERIRQIEAKALRKLRHPAVARHLDNPCYGRYRGKAHCNLYVPEWKREEERQAERQAERREHEVTLQHWEMAREIADLKVLAESEARRAERELAQAEAVAARERLRERRFDLDPAHVAEYARVLTDMLTQARQARWL